MTPSLRNDGPKGSVFNPVEQRVFGLVKIAEGIVTLALGKYAPAWTYRYAKWGAWKHHER